MSPESPPFPGGGALCCMCWEERGTLWSSYFQAFLPPAQEDNCLLREPTRSTTQLSCFRKGVAFNQLWPTPLRREISLQIAKTFPWPPLLLQKKQRPSSMEMLKSWELLHSVTAQLDFHLWRSYRPNQSHEFTTVWWSKNNYFWKKNEYFDNVSEFGFANAAAPWQTHLGTGEKMAAIFPLLVLGGLHL